MEAFSHMMVTVAALATNPRALGKYFLVLEERKPFLKKKKEES